MRSRAASCCALLLACAARGAAPSAPGAPETSAARPRCSGAPPGGAWQRGHEPPPSFAWDRERSPPPSPRIAAGALPPVPFTRWPPEMVSWSSLGARATIYAQRWPRERSPEAFLRHHLERLTENAFVDVRVDPGSVARREVERGGRRFVAEELAFTTAGHVWRNLLYAAAAPGDGVCAYGVTAPDLGPESDAMIQFLRLVDGAPR